MQHRHEGRYDDMEPIRRPALLERQREPKRVRRIRGHSDENEQPEEEILDRHE